MVSVEKFVKQRLLARVSILNTGVPEHLCTIVTDDPHQLLLLIVGHTVALDAIQGEDLPPVFWWLVIFKMVNVLISDFFRIITLPRIFLFVLGFRIFLELLRFITPVLFLPPDKEAD